MADYTFLMADYSFLMAVYFKLSVYSISNLDVLFILFLYLAILEGYQLAVL